MTERVYLQDMSVLSKNIVWVTTRGAEAWAGYDLNLGSIMTAISWLAKAVSDDPRPTRELSSETTLDEFRIEPLTVEPFAFRLVMASGPHRFVCNLDRDLEHILLGFGAAMKFFALKRGLVIVDPEVTRNAEFAREHGLYTPPEGTA